MSLLAERKRKTKWVVNPTKKPLWTTDSPGIKLGKEIMEKMGWELGKGLGQKEQGMLEPLKVSYKNDTKGMGFKGKDEEWIEQQDEFNFLLSQLATNGNSPADVEEKEKVKIKSLEEKSRQSRARVHYQKFTKGKDLSKYSENDLACILGTKLSKINKEEQDQNTDTKAETSKEGYETSYGVTTIKSGFIQDYFMKKRATVKPNESSENILDESFNNRNNNELENIPNDLDNSQFENKKKGKRKFELVETSDNNNEKVVNFKSKRKKKNKEEINTRKESDQESDSFNNSNKIKEACEVESLEMSNCDAEKALKRKKLKKKHKDNIENDLVDLENLLNQNNEMKKKKKRSREIGNPNQTANDKFTKSEIEILKHSENEMGDKNETVDKIEFDPSSLLEKEDDNLKEEYNKKKRKKEKKAKKEKYSEEKEIELFENENLNVEIKKKKKKHKKENQPKENLLEVSENLVISTNNILEKNTNFESTLSENLEDGNEYKELSSSNLLENDSLNTDITEEGKKKKHLKNCDAMLEKKETENLGKIDEENLEKTKNNINQFESVENVENVIHSHKMELFYKKKKKVVCEKGKILKLRYGFEIEKFKGSNLINLPGYGVNYRPSREAES